MDIEKLSEIEHAPARVSEENAAPVLRTRDDRKRAMLAGLERGLTPTAAAKEAGLAREQVQRWRRNDPTFDAAVTAARAAGCESLEHEIQTAALELPPGTARVHSENLKWLLSKRRPDVYGDRVAVDLNANVDIAAALEAGRARAARLRRDQERTIEGSALVAAPDPGSGSDTGAVHDSDADAAERMLA